MRSQRITKILAGVTMGAAVAVSPVAMAGSAFEVFLKVDNIPGDVRDASHPDEINVLSWSWGESRSSAKGTVDCVAFKDLSFTHYVDKASSNLMQSLALGQPTIPNAKLTVRTVANQLEFIVIEMSNVIVTSVSTDSSGLDSWPAEKVTLSFAAMKFTYALGGGSPGVANIADTCKK